MKVVTAEQMRVVDMRAQREFGMSADALMLRAGQAIAGYIREHWNPAVVAIVCGKGNNGGDGFVVAHELSVHGIEPVVILVEPESELRGAAWNAFGRLAATRVRVVSSDRIAAELAMVDLVVDAVLGTGTSGLARAPYAAAIGAINAARRPVVSVDVPSGLQETPVAGGDQLVVRATATVTIGLPKLALLSWPGVQYAGHLVVEPIGFPTPLLEDANISVNWTTPGELASWLPTRAGDANKGTFGSVGIVAGSAPYAGAALLVARAALRAGCGLAYIVTTAQQNPIYKVGLPEAVTIITRSVDPDWLDATDIDKLVESLGRLTALVIGPGLGTTDSSCALVRDLLARTALPAVVDADALTCAARNPVCASAITNRPNTVITPHPGELGRLLGITAAEIQSDRLTHVRAAAEKFGVVVLLKGASTLVAEPGGQVHIVPGACSALAKGGTGDVLAGVIGSLIAQGCVPMHAAVLGAHLHLQAGHACAQRSGPHGVLASEVADEIPRVLQTLNSGGA